MNTALSRPFSILLFVICFSLLVNSISAQSKQPPSQSNSSAEARNFSTETTAHITSSLSSSSYVTTLTWKYNHSSLVDPNIDLEPNGRGEAYAFACQSTRASYSRASSAARSAGSTLVSHATYISIATYSTGVADIYTTLCDKIPRAHGSGPTSSSTFYRTSTFSDFTETIYNSAVPSIQPSCNINPNDCAPLLTSYSSESAAFESFKSSFTQPVYITPTPQPPACTTPTSAPSGCGKCTIGGANVQLLYWPVTVEGDFCGQRTTIVNNATTTRSVVSGGITFASPSVYVSFKSLYAFDSCSSEIGSRIEGTVLAMQSDKLSSARGNHLQHRTPYSLNYADLNVPVPASVYCAQPQFDWFPCNTIYDGGYTSFMLWLPDDVSTMRPEWSTCEKAVWGVYDPPHALQTADQLTPDISSSWTNTATVTAPATTTTAQLTAIHTSQNIPAVPAHTLPDGPKPTQGFSNPADVGIHDPSSQDPGGDAGQRSDGANLIGNAVASMIGLVKPSKTLSASSEAGAAGAMVIEQFDSAGIVVHGSTVPFSSLGDGYQAFTTVDASGSRIFIASPGSTLTVGGAPTVINGHTLSAGEQGVIVDGSITMAYTNSRPSTVRNPSIGTASVLQVTTSEGGIMHASSMASLLHFSLLVILITL